jgi:hypothetical protein
MPVTEMFLALAEIAGVFVGFGALIALRSGGPSGPSGTFDVLLIGMVVWVAIAVVIMALAPVSLSVFGITGHTLWLACSVLALVVFFGGDEVIARTWGERRAYLAKAPIRRRWKGELGNVVTVLPGAIALGLVILGVLPEQEAALYFLAVALILLLAALLLLQAVFRTGYAAWGVAQDGQEAEAPAAPSTPAPSTPARATGGAGDGTGAP